MGRRSVISRDDCVRCIYCNDEYFEWYKPEGKSSWVAQCRRCVEDYIVIEVYSYRIWYYEYRNHLSKKYGWNAGECMCNLYEDVLQQGMVV